MDADIASPAAEALPRDAAGVHAPLLLHIGFHKTASTWLQANLFDDGALGFTARFGGPRHQLVADIVRPDPLFFDPACVRTRYAPFLDDAGAAGRTLVLSHERFSGYPSSGGRDRQMIAERLAATFPQARILIVIREQHAVIRSMYSQHVTDGGVEGIARFLAPAEPYLLRRPGFRREFYAYNRLIDLYARLFGRDRVLVLPFELLAREPSCFAGAIARHCGQPATPVLANGRVNVARPLLMQWVQRPLNMLFYHNELSPGALFHISRFHKRYARLAPLFRAISPGAVERRLDRGLRQAIAAHVGGYYAHSNALTQAHVEHDLRSLGYQVGE